MPIETKCGPCQECLPGTTIQKDNFMAAVLQGLCTLTQASSEGFTDIEINPMCDTDGLTSTGFFRVYARAADGTVTITDLSADLTTPYVITGTVSIGTCIPAESGAVTIVGDDVGLAKEVTLQLVETNTSDSAGYLSSLADTVKSNGVTANFGIGVLGSDGVDARWLKTDVNGELQVDVLTLPAITGSVTVSGTVAATQSGTWNINNVSGTISLPTGAATEAKQDTQITSLQLLDDAVATTAAAIPAKGFAVAGTDGTNARILKTDSSGELQVDVLTLPAITGSVTVSGTVAATQSGTWNINNVSGTVSLPTGASTAANQTTQITSLQLLDDVVATTAAAIPTKGYAVSGTDGTNARILKTDTNGELQVDVLTMPTVTVTGTVAATQSGTWNINNISGTVSLPTGAATEATLSTLNGKVTACNTGAVTISSALPAGANTIGSIASITTSVTPGTAAANLGKAEDAAHTTGDVGVFSLAVRSDTAAATAGTTGDYTAIITDALGKLWTADNQTEDTAHTSGDRGSFILGVSNTGGTSFGANGDYTPIATDLAGRVVVTERTPTATLANVAASASNVTLFSANANATGRAIYNDSSAILYVKLGTTASTTSFTVKMQADQYYEVPFGYTGQIDGIWASATGSARTTETT